MELVKATAADVDTLVELSWRTFYEAFNHLNTPENMAAYMNKAFTEEKLLAEINNDQTDFFLVRRENAIIGYMKLNRNGAQSEFHESDSMEIERIYIDGKHQGNGIGTQLLSKAKEIACQHGCKYLWLGVWENNPGAIRFYERNGFRVFSSHLFEMGDDMQTDKLMICRVM